jgi:hypothetical protein
MNILSTGRDLLGLCIVATQKLSVYRTDWLCGPEQDLCVAQFSDPQNGINNLDTCVSPIILATQEAEIRRMVVQSQPRQIVHKTRPQKKPNTK